MYYILMQTGTPETANPIVGFLPFVFLILILYFLMIRPQQKRQKEHQKLLDELKIGDEVITTGGLVGRIANFKKEKDTVIVKVDDNCKIEIKRGFISGLIQDVKNEPTK